MIKVTDYRLVLASNSPRRKELLAGIDVEYEVRTLPDVDESYPETLPYEEVAAFLARKKAAAYLSVLKENELLITADTIVLIDGTILGKPADKDDAARMLRMLPESSIRSSPGFASPHSKSKRAFQTLRMSPSARCVKKRSTIISPAITLWTRPAPMVCRSG